MDALGKDFSRSAIRSAILRHVGARALKTLCPSEVARDLADDEAVWRALMPQIRAEAAALADEGRVVVTQKGAVVDARTARGPIRLSRAGDE
ncbi:MAG: DUF3253 domain-containing protein [Pseudomonadota bacterium]